MAELFRDTLTSPQGLEGRRVESVPQALVSVCVEPKAFGTRQRDYVVELMRRLEVHHPRSRRRPPLKEHAWWLSDWERAWGVAHPAAPVRGACVSIVRRAER